MITNIKVRNFKSIYNKVELDFTKSQINYYENYVTKDNIVNPIVLYGDNASGKSCFLEVFKTIYNLLHIDVNNDTETIYFDYNRYLAKVGEEIEIEITMMLRDKKYVYQVSGFDFDGIGKEKLYYDDEVILESKETVVYKYSKLREVGVSVVFDDKTTKIDKHISNVFNFLSNVQFMTLEGSISSNINKNYIDTITQNQDKINEILKDIISDFTPVEFIVERYIDGSRYLTYKEQDSNVQLSVDTHMSNGIKKLFSILSFLIEVPNNSTVVIDEIENMIHPVTLIKLVQKFNELFNIQLIVSTHNTSLMTKLRPDQIFLVRMKEHNSYIKRLNNIYPKLREVHNIEKLYYNETINKRFDEMMGEK